MLAVQLRLPRQVALLLLQLGTLVAREMRDDFAYNGVDPEEADRLLQRWKLFPANRACSVANEPLAYTRRAEHVRTVQRGCPDQQLLRHVR